MMSGLLGFNAQGAALVLILAAAVLVYLAGHANGISSQSRTRRFPTPFRRSQAGQAQVLNLKDVGDQLQAVMRASFQTRRVLSPSEYRVFRIIEDDVATMRKGHRVFAQTSLGEFSSHEALTLSLRSTASGSMSSLSIGGDFLSSLSNIRARGTTRERRQPATR